MCWLLTLLFFVFVSLVCFVGQLSQDETYADIAPVRLVNSTSEAVSAYISIMRGCNNM